MQKTSVLYPPFLNGAPQLIANANLDTHDVRIYKFHKMLVTNCRGRISPRFCNSNSKQNNSKISADGGNNFVRDNKLVNSELGTFL